MKIKYILLLSGILLSCQTHSPRAFQQLLQDFETALPRIFPDYAAAMGDPQATDILVIPTRERLQGNLSFCKKYLASFKAFDQLTDHQELNAQRIEKIEILTGMIAQMTGVRSPFNDPAFYNIYPALAWRNSQLRQFADTVSINLLLKTLAKVPVYFTHAKANLEDPDMERTIMAIELQEKTLEFLRTILAERIDSLAETTAKKNLRKAREKAAIAVKDYSVFCKSILVELKKLERFSDQ